MVTIRLTRRGAKNQPFYHVVVTDSRERQGGSSLENVGYFNPVARGKDTRLKLDLERIDHWLSLGAQQSDRVRTLVAKHRREAAPTAAARLQATHHDAEELSALSASVQSDLQQLRKGLLAKDLGEKLKKMEKLSKKLRRDMEP